MQAHTKEHSEMMDFFEKTFRHFRLDREDKSLWPKGNIYQSGEANDAFIAFRHGVAYGHAVAQ